MLLVKRKVDMTPLRVDRLVDQMGQEVDEKLKRMSKSTSSVASLGESIHHKSTHTLSTNLTFCNIEMVAALSHLKVISNVLTSEKWKQHAAQPLQSSRPSLALLKSANVSDAEQSHKKGGSGSQIVSAYHQRK